MPIKFVSLSQDFIDLVKEKGYQGYCQPIEQYQTVRKTYFMSPANSIGFMDGGIDLPLSTIFFPEIDNYLMELIKNNGKSNLIDRKYLPVGSAIMISNWDKYLANNKNFNFNRKIDHPEILISCPTMLLPQNINGTKNVYYATMSFLYMILIVLKENLEEVDLILTSSGCGYGRISYQESFQQFLEALKDYSNPDKYNPQIIKKLKLKDDCLENIMILYEPNLSEQPNTYMNTEFKKINLDDLMIL